MKTVVETEEKPSAAAGKIAHTSEMLWHFEGRMIRCGDFAAGELPTKGMAEVIVGEHNRAILALLAKREQREANARLIAAAPELLEACEEAEAILEGLCDGAPDASPLSKRANYVTRLLQVAIAKAEGKI